jgi:hypothetical protein
MADYVRSSDLTCRAPDCDVLAIECDVDHSIPYSQGGADAPIESECQCRTQRHRKTQPRRND